MSVYENDIRETLEKETPKVNEPPKPTKPLNPDKRKEKKVKTVKESEING